MHKRVLANKQTIGSQSAANRGSLPDLSSEANPQSTWMSDAGGFEQLTATFHFPIIDQGAQKIATNILKALTRGPTYKISSHWVSVGSLCQRFFKFNEQCIACYFENKNSNSSTIWEKCTAHRGLWGEYVMICGSRETRLRAERGAGCYSCGGPKFLCAWGQRGHVCKLHNTLYAVVWLIDHCPLLKADLNSLSAVVEVLEGLLQQHSNQS